MTIDPRNARGEDPWTSLEGTAHISPTHCDTLAGFLRQNDRPAGWTSGEIRDSYLNMDHEEIHRRLADLGRDGRAYTTGETRRDPRTRGQQRAWRAGTVTEPVPLPVPAQPAGGPAMMLPPCVLWMDPGMISGLAWLWAGGESFYASEYPFAEVGGHIEDTCRQYGRGLVLGYETYKVRPDKPQTNARDAGKLPAPAGAGHSVGGCAYTLRQAKTERRTIMARRHNTVSYPQPDTSVLAKEPSS